MLPAYSNVHELPRARQMREDLAEAEKGRVLLAGAGLYLIRALSEAQETARALEAMCDVEKRRADEAEAAVSVVRVEAARAIRDTESRFGAVAAEIEQLQRQLAASHAHATSIALMRAALERRQAELDAAINRNAELEEELAALRAERAADGALAIAVARECAKLAASRAEGFAIAQEILSYIGALPE